MTEKLPANQSSTDIWKSEETNEGPHVEVHFFPNGETPTGPEHIHAIHALARKALLSWGFDPERVGEIELVLAELANNGNEHGDGVREVALDYSPETLRVQVVNGLRGEVRPINESQRGQLMNDAPNDSAEDGRGLMLTEALADEWDLQVEPDRVVTYADFRNLQRQDDDPLPPLDKAA
jgi:anti-sigma regulatory factor (Ser/Thr protein kinase)